MLRPTPDAPRSTRRAPALLAAALVATAAVSACSVGDEPAPAPTTTTVQPGPVNTPSSSPTATSSSPTFDCPSVQTAQAALDGAYGAELDRLGIDRGDPRAQSVFTLVTTDEAPEYYAAVLAAAPPEASDDARVVLDYYTQLASRVGTLDVGNGSVEELATAMAEIDAAGEAVNPDLSAATAVVQAQERLQAQLDRDCSGSPGAGPSESSQSPAPSTTTS